MVRILMILAVAFAFVQARPAAAAPAEDLSPQLRAALLKVHVTRQSWKATSPWNKRSPSSIWQRGVVVRPGLVLTPARDLADHLMIEVSEANSARTYPAKLEHIDYGANLALVRIQDEGLLERTSPLELGNPITIDHEFEVHYLGGSDLLQRTEGLVQAVSPSGSRLELTVKMSLAEAGNGQAAIRDGRLVGFVIQSTASRQQGKLIAVETIRHYLEDFDSGEYRGFGSGGFWTHDLLRDDLRAYYGVPDDLHGIAISRVVAGKTGDGALQEGDVILRIEDYPLDDEGMFEHPLHGRMHNSYLLLGATHAGDEVPLRILRQGKTMDLTLLIRDWPHVRQMVPLRMYDRRPPYMVVGGLVILELNRSSRVRAHHLSQYKARAWWDPPGERKRIIYASRVLQDPANKGLEKIGDRAILTVNGKMITCLEDVPEALKHPQDGYHVFTFEGIEKPFVIRAEELAEIDGRIAERYKIPELSYFGEE